jgi:hypothetical protein
MILASPLIAPPQTYVMTCAWYGAALAGDQTECAVKKLAQLQAKSSPSVLPQLMKGRYADDILGEAETEDEQKYQIIQFKDCIAMGGLEPEFIVLSGETPPQAATTDGQTTTCLGLTWEAGEDTVALDVSQLSVRKRPEGTKCSLPLAVESPKDLCKAIHNNVVSKAAILGRIAEMFGPGDYGNL